MYQTLREIWSAHQACTVLDWSEKPEAILSLVSGPDSAGKCVVVNSRGEYELRNADIRYWKVQS